MKNEGFLIRFLGMAFLAAMVCLAGCAVRMQKNRPVSFFMEEYPRILLRKAMEWNQDIDTARGKGWLTIDSQRLKTRFKMIWAARNQATPQARLTLLDAGLPIETMLFNGGKKSASSPGTSGRSRVGRSSGQASVRNITNRNIGYVFPVEVPVDHVVRLLLGQLPISSFVRAKSSFHGGKNSKTPVTMTTENDTDGLHQNITWDAQGRMHKIRMETPSGNMIYSIEFSRWKQIRQYRIPYRVAVRNPQGEEMILDITDWTPDVPVKASVFHLQR